MAGRPWSVAAWTLATVLLVGLIFAFESNLPELVKVDGSFTSLQHTCYLALEVLFALGAVLSARRYRQAPDVIIGYVGLLQVALVFVVLDTIIGGKRYDFWWYLARLLMN